MLTFPDRLTVTTERLPASESERPETVRLSREELSADQQSASLSIKLQCCGCRSQERRAIAALCCCLATVANDKLQCQRPDNCGQSSYVMAAVLTMVRSLCVASGKACTSRLVTSGA